MFPLQPTDEKSPNGKALAKHHQTSAGSRDPRRPIRVRLHRVQKEQIHRGHQGDPDRADGRPESSRPQRPHVHAHQHVPVQQQARTRTAHDAGSKTVPPRCGSHPAELMIEIFDVARFSVSFPFRPP